MFPESPQTEYDSDISGTAVRLTVKWLERPAGWYLDVALPDGTAVVKGRRLSAKRTPLEGLRILHVVGDSEVLLPIGGATGEAGRLQPSTPFLLERPPTTLPGLGLSVVAITE